MKRYVVEFIGTFFIVLMLSLVEDSFLTGLMYMAMLYFGARISGAHYNPAITQAMWLRGKFETNRIAPYVIAQVLGAAAALLVEHQISGSLYVPDVSPTDNLWFICLLEALFAFVLCYIYLVTRTVHAFKNTQLYGLILGFTLICLSAPGGLFNPAIGFAALGLHGLLTGSIMQLAPSLLVYVVCPLIGSALAGFAFDYLEAPVSGQFASVDTAD